MNWPVENYPYATRGDPDHDLYEAAMKATTQEEADTLVEQLKTSVISRGVPREDAEKKVRDNIGYWTGYHDPVISERVFGLFRTEHPILRGQHLSPAELLRLGMAWYEKRQQGLSS